MRRALAVVSAVVALAAPAAAYAGFSPNDPLAQRQWYIEKDRVFDSFNSFSVLPQLLTVRVAVIDSGVDVSHPELKGRIVEARSFVGGSANDVQGHGTFVAGEIAALTDNGLGIAGLAPPARLLVAKVVRDDGSIPPRAEARAIRWAVRSGAKVINLSLGGTRDPSDPSVDGFSYEERRAIDYAVRTGALVVASVGNGEDAPSKPWRFASYPAALPHVLGVAAYGRSGGVPSFSNRDDVFVDITAPGQDMLSLFPRSLTKAFPACQEQGYSSCGPKEYRHADGTSFSSPQVAAAAALLFALMPNLRPDQVSAILERAADDASPADGCDACSPGRDELTGNGRLDVTAAIHSLRGQLPPSDRFEPNDDAGREAQTVFRRALAAKATLDTWDDPNDVYRIHLRRGQGISVRVRSGSLDTSLVLWKPGLQALALATDELRARRSIHPEGVPERLVYRARTGGWYYVQVKLARPGSGQYAIRIAS
ncbi:MAG: S8 family serine peptidase [Actinomycetota bacterium]|nr:S8 family serine peptidase [Actinomycetota bacterium]